MTTEFMHQYRIMCEAMLETPVVHTGTWQSTDTTGSPLHATHEIQDALFLMDIPASASQLQTDMPAVNLPWAEHHFQERVGGKPLNPPPSHTEWPWARHNARFQEGEQGPFSHSYPERIWPRFSGMRDTTGLQGNFVMHEGKLYRSIDGSPFAAGDPIDVSQFPRVDRKGIRFRYGDLSDLVHLLLREPLTRQAYLPIWFPEDTGNHMQQRVPCSLGYHFMQRDNRLSCRYFMRSCDLVRHFPDDVYMAARLTQWIVDQINAALGMPFSGGLPTPCVETGHLRMHMTSLHAFVGDKYLLEKIIGKDPVHDRIGGSSVPS